MWGAVPSQVAAVAGSQSAVAVHPDGVLVVPLLPHRCGPICLGGGRAGFGHEPGPHTGVVRGLQYVLSTCRVPRTVASSLQLGVAFPRGRPGGALRGPDRHPPITQTTVPASSPCCTPGHEWDDGPSSIIYVLARHDVGHQYDPSPLHRMQRKRPIPTSPAPNDSGGGGGVNRLPV